MPNRSYSQYSIRSLLCGIAFAHSLGRVTNGIARLERFGKIDFLWMIRILHMLLHKKGGMQLHRISLRFPDPGLELTGETQLPVGGFASWWLAATIGTELSPVNEPMPGKARTRTSCRKILWMGSTVDRVRNGYYFGCLQVVRQR